MPIVQLLAKLLELQLWAARQTARLMMRRFSGAALIPDGPIVLVAEGLLDQDTFPTPSFLEPDDKQPRSGHQRLVNHLEQCLEHPSDRYPFD